MNKVCETGPPVYRPYPRRLESLIICRCHYKDSTFSSVILRPVSVGPAGIRTFRQRFIQYDHTIQTTDTPGLKPTKRFIN